ncbi:MAG: PAS domain-containing sensor histidine kinase [Arcobacter sp.]|jgi:PAS domain S-box-containing protein|uniref:PAS domain-containing sensor histidine kinase n=1 Tax=Arcobacter sp. TaxID=1872629 RepID=UPI002A756DC1|nr:PAS domain-containing sensor histidine kinase [Arcobacter sp.]MDY3201513.1 PAS domain-containing sensor histidine kinase [Arcobacter sp.]
MNTQQQTLLSTLFNESLDAILVLDLKTQKFILFNQKALELYNYTKEEFKEITPKDLTLEFLTPEEMKKRQKNILEKGWDRFKTKHKTKDGKALDVLIKSKRIELNVESILLYITVINLGKEQKIEQEFETIFYSSKDGIATIDLDGKFIRFNDSFKQLSEYSYNELINIPVFDLFHQENKEKIKELIPQVIKKKYIENFETTFITKYEKSMITYITMNLMPNQKEILLIIKDFTLLKLIDLEKKFKSLNELIQNISHQWKQPLSTISIIASGIKLQNELKLYDVSNLDNDMSKIVEITNYLSNIINNFDDMAFENLEKSYSLCQLMKEILHDMKNLLNKNHIKIITDYKIDNKVYIDKFRFSEAIKNILNNSIEAFIEKNIDNRIILIKTENIDNHITLKIQDNAGGVDEDILPKILEPYFTTKHQSQGTGLGLTNSYKIIVEMHKYLFSFDNCHIKFDNEEYKGFIVSITF